MLDDEGALPLILIGVMNPGADQRGTGEKDDVHEMATEGFISLPIA